MCPLHFLVTTGQFKTIISSSPWMLVARACNPSYLGDRDQEDHQSQPEQILCETLSQKYPSKKGLVKLLKV
jgi:hypothetical protein